MDSLRNYEFKFLTEQQRNVKPIRQEKMSLQSNEALRIMRKNERYVERHHYMPNAGERP